MSTILVTIKALFALSCIQPPALPSAVVIQTAECSPCVCGGGYGSAACLRFQADKAEEKEKHDKQCAELISKLQEAVK